jgi:hypothetical protein
MNTPKTLSPGRLEENQKCRLRDVRRIEMGRKSAIRPVRTVVACMLGLLLACGVSVRAGSAGIVIDSLPGRSAEYGLATLEEALRKQGLSVQRLESIAQAQTDVLILAGLASNQGTVPRMLKVLNAPLPEGPEALAVRRTEVEGKPTVLLCGSDDRGLMYAALDVADRVSWNDTSGNPFAHVRDASEKPYVIERAVSIYTMQRAYFESRLYDQTHWQRYFDMLARSRINSFVVIFGYENGGFMAPPYPYFFDVAEFPDVKLIGITAEQQQRNVAAFRRMIEIAHAHGVDFTAGIWDHIYRGGVQGGGIAGASERASKPTEGLVWGVTGENLAAYNKAAIHRFLEVFPDIDGLQFRMHSESGLKRNEMKGFWHEIFGMVRQMRPEMRLDLRAKELPDEVIEDGLDQGLKLRVATKYWMEQMGLPFHPTHVNRQNQHDRRHGYADLLRYPQRYRVHWRLWNGGTSRLLLWGDPDYVRRFAQSAHLYAGDSFEINEMLATWMLGEPHDSEPLALLDPKYRYYDYEFERYWHYHQVWGRVSYNPDTPAEVWNREFDRRFGAQAGPLLAKALHLASKVLPRIVAASYRYQLFPTTRGWAEMMRIDDLPQYSDAEGSDVQQFMNMRDQAKSMIEGTDTAMRRPAETSRWFRHVAGQILDNVAQAEKSIGNRGSNEFVSTVVDLKILAGLAQYHSQRLQAGVRYNLYEQTGDLFALDDAIGFERQAVGAWERMVEAASDVYSKNLAVGVHRVGFSRHWEEELQKLRNGLKKLEEVRQKAQPRTKAGLPCIAHVPVRRHAPGEAVRLRATVGTETEPAQAQVRFYSEGQWHSVDMRAASRSQYEAIVPVTDATDQIKYFIEARDNRNRVGYVPEAGAEDPIVMTITADDQPPGVNLERVQSPKPGNGVNVAAKVWDSSGVKSVRLRYRHVTQFEDYQAAEMQYEPETGLWSVTIPGQFIVPEWDLMYFIEAVDAKGNGRMYPDMDAEAPYVIVKLDR